MDEKRVFFVRHAEANYPDLGQSDTDRTLTNRGKEDAQKLGSWLQKYHYIPDEIWASSAVRTTETANIISKNLNYPEEKLKFEDSIYQASVLDIIELLQQTSKNIQSLMLVGHNPTISDLIPSLTTSSGSHFPPCTIALLSFRHEWSELDTHTGRLLWLKTAYDLKLEQ